MEFDEACRIQRERMDLIDLVRTLMIEFYMLNSAWPSKAWLAQQIGLSR